MPEETQPPTLEEVAATVQFCVEQVTLANRAVRLIDYPPQKMREARRLAWCLNDAMSLLMDANSYLATLGATPEKETA